jgi:hypothetical protein
MQEFSSVETRHLPSFDTRELSSARQGAQQHVVVRRCLGLLFSHFSSSAPRTPPWSSSTVEFVEQVLLHKKRGVGGVPPEVLQEKRGVGL